MAQNKKEMIVRAAIEVFRNKGIEKTKISDIVQVAGVAQGTFYLYFPSKLSLMPAIAEVMVEKTMEILRSAVSEKASFSDQMQQFVEAIFKINEEYHEIQALIYSGLASTEHLKEWEAVYEPIYVWLSEKLDKAKDTGEIRNSIRSAHTAKLIIGLVESAAEQIYLYDSQAENMADTQKKEVKEFLKHALQME
ncbi:TetR family transcriptional regulator [Sporosarcina cyprini]|uniref:TetR family transcriptional regulator n=1 Tax=Sporosarcina cyprini TaxID=2910523 RepID=UPI001EDEA6B5|nr:TetR family transcriptional regulator [Sporosarcina cyprini]MCG3089487.1 TetR family transcriptional regulator [Sporosarcina cyprini]